MFDLKKHKVRSKLDMNLLIVTGLQKSGTSLLNRMLMGQSCVSNPFLPEGKFFWGDDPPFSPKASPCGELYQKHLGKRGHYLGESDFRASDERLLMSRVEHAKIKTPILMNKNPYNSVRIKWIKKIFPDAKVVSMFRNPHANVFSLLKKYIDHDNRGLGPENGWWGVKPKNWQEILSDNKIEQLAKQWQSVNQQILNDINDVDLLIEYSDLCSNPNTYLQKIFSLWEDNYVFKEMPVCQNFDNEYKTGSRLLSKNREYQKNKELDLSMIQENKGELPPFDSKDINIIQNICSDVWIKLKIKKKK